MVYYLSIWYTRRELASRIGIFYAALVASSAFGGLLAYGMFQITNETYFRWSYLFFLEGALTMTWAILLFFILPSGSQTAWFLTPAEKEVAHLRLEQDSVSTLDLKFNWKEALSEFTTPHGYIRVCMAFVAGTILTSNANFLAMVVKRLGYSVVKTNLVSCRKVPDYCAQISDKKPVYSCSGISRGRHFGYLVQILRPLSRPRIPFRCIGCRQLCGICDLDYDQHLKYIRLILRYVSLHHGRTFSSFYRYGNILIMRPM